MLFAVTLRVAQLIARTEAEGPGVRFAVWVQGCPLRCAGCCNPEMLAFEGGEPHEPEALAGRAARAGVDGVTLLGGEPFAQAEACARFANAARAHGLDVMIFSGFTHAELEAREDAGARALLGACDLLVDGRFERDRPDRARRWIGSTNQVMHFLSARFTPDDPRFRAPNTAELRLEGGVLTMNGWPGLVPKVALARRRA